MALKDLIAQRAELAEQQIEDIVADFARYDVDETAVIILPASATLSNKAKVLIYLVALQGWRYVSDDPVPAEATPADMEGALNIPGGTLRPVLKDLKDRHVIASRGKNYFVRAAALDAVKAEIGSSGDGTGPRVATKRGRRGSKKAAAKSKAKKKADGKGVRRGDKTAKFDTWVAEGFFDEFKTLNDVHSRFHEKGEIIPRTSVPGYLLQAIRDGRLSRKKREVDGKMVWTYETKSKQEA